LIRLLLPGKRGAIRCHWASFKEGDPGRSGALLSPLAEGADRPLGALLLHTAQANFFGQRELDLVQIFVSFGTEVLRAT
jgi:hypothetical protein